jgi:hypothetical protein
MADGERPDEGGSTGPRPGRRWGRPALVTAAVAVVGVLVAALLALSARGDDRPPAAAAASTASSSAPDPATPPTTGRSDPSDAGAAVTAAATATSGAGGYPPVSAAEGGQRLASAQADLARVSAELTEPVLLRSPTAWDQWLPAMKPYPGASTADDVATCPALAAGLSAALGHRMSYWTGTLPMGPVGCTWAPVPLQYDTIDYPFTVSVGFVSDGTTAAQQAGSAVTVLNGDQPRSCPTTGLPGGAVLAACWGTGRTSIELAVPDARGAGVWVLDADAKDGEAVTARAAFRALLAGVARSYG